MAMFRSLVASAQQRQPAGGPAGGDSGLEAQYSCPICLEVYHRPVAIGSCGHTFCGECLQPCLQVPSPLCPLCRLPFDPKKVDKAAHVEKQLSSYKAPCRGCNKKVTLAKMRVHVSSCMKVQEQMANCPKFVPVVPTSQPIPSAVPNRSTFTCPYCGARNLDQQELLKHCVDNHRSDPNRVVCPICSAMPWGDPSYKSANFLQHLLHRHKFSYDTFVVGVPPWPPRQHTLWPCPLCPAAQGPRGIRATQSSPTRAPLCSAWSPLYWAHSGLETERACRGNSFLPGAWRGAAGALSPSACRGPETMPHPPAYRPSHTWPHRPGPHYQGPWTYLSSQFISTPVHVVQGEGVHSSHRPTGCSVPRQVSAM
uniref:E3 ubiquitin-protein ligase RNF166 n=1 Tax=Canis lupus familiaris TaxID=9615 RepID=A0A8C0NSR2_CANLF